MDVLHCEYRLELFMGLDRRTEWRQYASGPRGEIYYVEQASRLNCGDHESLIISYEVLGKERTSARKSTQLFGVAHTFKVLIDWRKELFLRKAKWEMTREKKRKTRKEGEEGRKKCHKL